MRAHAISLLLGACLWVAEGTAGPQRATPENTRGWQLMSEQERIAHQVRLRSFANYADCHAYQLQHHAWLQQRAQARGARLSTQGRDSCAHLQPAAQMASEPR